MDVVKNNENITQVDVKLKFEQKIQESLKRLRERAKEQRKEEKIDSSVSIEKKFPNLNELLESIKKDINKEIK